MIHRSYTCQVYSAECTIDEAPITLFLLYVHKYKYKVLFQLLYIGQGNWGNIDIKDSADNKRALDYYAEIFLQCYLGTKSTMCNFACSTVAQENISSLTNWYQNEIYTMYIPMKPFPLNLQYIYNAILYLRAVISFVWDT